LSKTVGSDNPWSGDLDFVVRGFGGVKKSNGNDIEPWKWNNDGLLPGVMIPMVRLPRDSHILG
jgi:hypothetical protein